MAKVFENFLANRINCHIDNLDILNNQFGFLRGHSTEHALARLQNYINNGLNTRRITSIVALDLRAAFDVVWHDGLVHKLYKFNLNPILIKIIKSMLHARRFAVRDGNDISDYHNMPSEVPQGSCVSPIIFNLYIVYSGYSEPRTCQDHSVCR